MFQSHSKIIWLKSYYIQTEAWAYDSNMSQNSDITSYLKLYSPLFAPTIQSSPIYWYLTISIKISTYVSYIPCYIWSKSCVVWRNCILSIRLSGLLALPERSFRKMVDIVNIRRRYAGQFAPFLIAPGASSGCYMVVIGKVVTIYTHVWLVIVACAAAVAWIIE
jgi:hypothetical protein